MVVINNTINLNKGDDKLIKLTIIKRLEEQKIIIIWLLSNVLDNTYNGIE